MFELRISSGRALRDPRDISGGIQQMKGPYEGSYTARFEQLPYSSCMPRIQLLSDESAAMRESAAGVLHVLVEGGFRV